MLRITTGQTDWSGGVNSDKAPTIASQENPNGLKPNQLAWLNNGSTRGNGLSPRKGWIRRAVMPRAERFQEGYMYEPDNALPYIMSQIGGRIYQVRVDTDYSVNDISAVSGLVNPATVGRGYMDQAEQFLVIQAGDFTTLPLFWDGTTLRRSIGPATSYGVTSADFVAPAVGQIVDVTLIAPGYTGPANGEILINGKAYQQVETQNVITLKNNANNSAGATVPAGTAIIGTNKTVYSATSFVIPAIGASVQVVTNPPWDGPVPANVGVTNAIQNFQITAAGTAPPAANHVLLMNVTDTPGGNVIAPVVLSSRAELPAGGPMDYYMGRMWVANGREYVAGDIVGGPTGTAPYEFRDSVLKMVENTYLSLGGTFRVPTNAGNIRAIKHTTALDTATGEGQLLVFTRQTIYSVNVVPTRALWQALTEPIQRVVQTNHGTTSDWSVAAVNGDLFYRSINGINSFFQADRFFGQWGNRPISVEEARAIDLDNRALLNYASGINFDNRLYQTGLPEESSVGVIHKGLYPFNFDTISTLDETLPPAWEGINEGLDILKVLKGDFGGRDRAFAFVRSRDTGDIELWELTNSEIEDSNAHGDSRIIWALETPAFTWESPFQLKELDTMELWIDRLYGTVEFVVQFRPDQHPCWEYWHKWKICTPKNNCEDVGLLTPCDYPSTIYKPSYRAPMVLPKAPSTCQDQNARPINVGFSFQFRIFIKGHCRLRGMLIHAYPKDRSPYERIVCGDEAPASAPMAMRTI